MPRGDVLCPPVLDPEVKLRGYASSESGHAPVQFRSHISPALRRAFPHKKRHHTFDSSKKRKRYQL